MSQPLDGVTIPGRDVMGDCQVPVCVDGAPQQMPDNDDVPNDGNLCTLDSCQEGTPSSVPAPDGTSCGQNLMCVQGMCM
jgi:hypothetical protein